MNGDDVNARLRALDERLARLEQAVWGSDLSGAAHRAAAGAAPPAPAASVPPAPAASVPPAAPASGAPRAAAHGPTPPHRQDVTVTNVLGWSGAVALVLAAAYLIRLAIVAGWLTPIIQVGAAALLGILLIGAGVGLRRADDDYLGLLPAAGIAILFLSVYGAHLLYHLIAARAALAAVIAISGISLVVCVVLDSTLYAVFAVAGSYSAPFLLAGSGGSLADVAVYFCAWSVTFTIFAIARGRRLIYLLALYVALIGFDAVARAQALEWRLILAFQTVQFVIFGIGTLAFSIRRREPLDGVGAMLHLPALLLFYALQYALLDAHVPSAAPWVALGSLLAVALLYGLARSTLGRRSAGGELLLGLYAALVLFHAGYLESVPAFIAPWVALAVACLALASRPVWKSAGYGGAPLLVAAAAIFVLNLLELFIGLNMTHVPAHRALGFLYALALYGGYLMVRGEPRAAHAGSVLLYAGHLTAMSAVVQLLHEPIIQSVAWGLLGLASLLGSLSRRDPLVGKSSLLLFAATGVKVVLIDLEGASPLARIASLAVLGATFYAGGLLYRRVSRLEAQLAHDA